MCVAIVRGRAGKRVFCLCKKKKRRRKGTSRCGVLWISSRARSGYSAPFRALAFFSCLTRSRFPIQRSPIFRHSPPQKHGEDRGNEGQTEEEEGTHVGRGCSHGKLQNCLRFVMFLNMSVFLLCFCASRPARQSCLFLWSRCGCLVV